MRGFLECQPCFVRQALDAARRVTGDEEVQAEVVRRVHRVLAGLDYRFSPPLTAVSVYGVVREVTGCDDPYREEKDLSNRAALDLYPWAKETVARSDDPFDTAMRLAIAANVVDFGIGGTFDLKESLRAVLERGLDIDESGEFTKALQDAETLLFIGDNSGEIVFDRLFLETIGAHHPSLKKYFAVRGGPIINDITTEDAKEVGIGAVAEIISTGFTAPGVILERSSGEFRELFRRADIVLAKGQGNYESIDADPGRPVFFLLRTKCPVTARDLDVPVGSFVLKRH